MWQEARKHERKLRGMMVDYKRRGERRREYYEKIKKDPAQFLQVHGRAYKIHLDSAVALAAESPVNMMPWQGDANNMIDRFDVRAHLDFILTYTPPLLNTATPEQESEERKCNYERYRGLVQNDFASISEEQCLYQIQMDELYGGLQRPNEDEKKKLAKEKATIGYTYEDSTVTEPGEEEEKGEEDDSENSESEEDEGIPDIDVEVDVDELNTEQELDLNKMATPYGMAEGDFVRMLRKDKDEVEAIKHAKALEAEKAMYSGRRSRRQRREFREKRLKGRQISPPSYARRDSPTYDPYKRPKSESSSESRSRSPGPEKITFITSFGGSDEEAAVATQAQPPVHSGHTPANSLHHPAGHSRGSRRRRSSSSPSSSSSRSSTHRSSSRSSSHSRRDRRRGGGRDGRYSRSRSRRRSDSRSRGRGANGGGRGGSRRRYDRTQSRSNDRDGDRERERERDRDRDVGRRFTARRRTRSNSRQGDRARQGGGGRTSGGHQRGVRSSPSPSQSPQPSCTPSPSHRGGPPSATALCDKLRKPDTPGGRETGAAKPKMTPQEMLKIRMQKALNRQSKADKKAAQAKVTQQENKRAEREGELRAMARKIRMKERERREKERDEWERQYGRQSHSPSPSKYGEFMYLSSVCSSGRDHSSSRRRSRSRSSSPYYRY
ncbi:CLK4-associating serine/arginine rich protein-like isoform X1 [Coregonus clupeaformis]|uniref:CLK4-associating serine/arginine rich protein-like isoform X1 n=1 Tax=Coregonus clupeaformis TaxID=59861 RepID=UPI001E1C4A30|nr:CLK4-associating serine/arginine rich protein-like isoform X1 [Coregonus clupeaformis]